MIGVRRSADVFSERALAAAERKSRASANPKSFIVLT